MNRVDRLSAILIQLQSRRKVKAQDIADRFNISLRTVYRDVKALELGGIPVIGEAGVGYSLADGYKLPPIMFTRAEIIALLTAEKLLGKLADESCGKSHRDAIDKIRSVLRSNEKRFLEGIENNIEVLESRSQRYHPFKIDPLQTIIEAIDKKKVLSLKYIPAYTAHISERYIEPIGIFYLDSFWHLIAYCRLRTDYRDFRFDRMHQIHLTDEVFTAEHPPLSEFISKIYPERSLVSIKIKVQSDAHPYVGEQKYYLGLVSEKQGDDWVEMEFLSSGIESFAYWYLSFADVAEVISPDDLRNHLLKRVETMHRRLKK